MHSKQTSLLLALAILPLPAVAGEPDPIAVSEGTLVATVQAVGAQVYECVPETTGERNWQFREPIATLFVDGKTVGRHYGGPAWEMNDSSAVTGKVAARAAAATPQDVPLLKLDVSSSRGTGLLSGVTAIQRINTRGGVAVGACDRVGAYLSVPYTADYAFYGKRG
ncbi:MAG: DUF3455 domain-containing protein [Oricola sp.]